MRREPLNSSILASAGFDPTVSLLELEFVSGEIYRYYAVPEKHYLGLMSSDSAGTYFNQHIRERFPSAKL